MKQRRCGCIILVSSLSGLAGSPGLSVYSASKAFLHGLAESLWIEMKPLGVDVLGFAIGRTATPAHARMFAEPSAGVQQAPDVVREVLQCIGDGPFNVPQQHRLSAHLLRTLSRADAVEYNAFRSRPGAPSKTVS